MRELLSFKSDSTKNLNKKLLADASKNEVSLDTYDAQLAAF